jgi:hypothetical protein
MINRPGQHNLPGMFVPPEKGDEHTDGPRHSSTEPQVGTHPADRRAIVAASSFALDSRRLSTGDDAQVFILADYQVTGNGQNWSNLLVSAPSAE